MNRRGFLKALGCLAAAPVAAKFIPSAIAVETPVAASYTTYLVGSEALLLENLRKEMSYRLGLSLDALVRLTYTGHDDANPQVPFPFPDQKFEALYPTYAAIL